MNCLVDIMTCGKDVKKWSVVVAQLVERLLTIPEVHGSNLDIGKIYNENLFIVNCIKKTKIRERGREWPILMSEN